MVGYPARKRTSRVDGVGIIPYTFPMKRCHILSVPVDALGRVEADTFLKKTLGTGRGERILSVNPEIVLKGKKDPVFRELLEKGDLLLPDGQGVVWALHRQRIGSERVTGADLFFTSLDLLNERHGSIYIVVAEHGLSSESDVREALRLKYPNIHWDDTTPDLVCVSQGAPIQEQWIAEHAGDFPSARTFLVIGGAVDFLTGRLQRSPPIFHRLGLEWLWRVVQQPNRLPRIFRAVIVFPLTVILNGSEKSPENKISRFPNLEMTKQAPKFKNVRVRFAPSPTGYLHIGGLRTVLYNFLFARHHNGTFILRIEDTDQARLVPGAKEKLLETLHTFGLDSDETPVIQSERLAIYQEHAEALVNEGKAYRCYCTAEELEQVRAEQTAQKKPTRYNGRCRNLNIAKQEPRNRPDKSVIRLAVPEGRTSVVFTDLIRGDITTPVESIDDAVLLKSDGFPTYHLANVVDDHLMKISHVIRGEEWISSTSKHVLLYEAFGWTPPQFAHLPLLLNPDKSKLSKRQGDVAVEDFLAKGYLPEALLNFVALLGWNPKADQEIYTLDELVSLFDITKVNASGAVLNAEKLEWMNGQYLRKLAPEARIRLVAEPLVEAGLLTEKAGGWHLPTLGRDVPTDWLMDVLECEQERLTRANQVGELLPFLFAPPEAYVMETLVWKKSDAQKTAQVLGELVAWVGEYGGDWKVKSLETALKEWIASHGYGNGDVLWPLRVALTGREASPGPFEMMSLLGKEETIKRLQHAQSLLT